MEAQLTIRLSNELARNIREAADKLGIKKSDVARLAISEYLEIANRISDNQPYEKIKHLIGAVASGVPDLGQSHREHLIERLKKHA